MQQIVLAEEHLDTTPSSGARVSNPQQSLSKTYPHFSRPSQESQKEGTKKGEAEKKVEKTKVIGGGENEKVKPKPEIVKKIVDDWEDEDEEEQEKRRAAGLTIFY